MEKGRKDWVPRVSPSSIVEQFLAPDKRQRIKEQYVDAKRKLREYNFELNTGVHQDLPSNLDEVQEDSGMTQKEKLYLQNMKMSETLRQFKREIELVEEEHDKRLRRLKNDAAATGSRLQRFILEDPSVEELIKDCNFTIGEDSEITDTRPLVETLKVSINTLLVTRDRYIDAQRAAITNHMHSAVKNMCKTIEIICKRREFEANAVDTDTFSSAVRGDTQYWKSKYQNYVYESTFLRDELETLVGENVCASEQIERLEREKDELVRVVRTSKELLTSIAASVKDLETRNRAFEEQTVSGVWAACISESVGVSRATQREQSIHAMPSPNCSSSALLKKRARILKSKWKQLVQVQKANIKSMKACQIQFDELNKPITAQVYEALANQISIFNAMEHKTPTGNRIPLKLRLLPPGDPVQLLRERERFLMILCDACAGGEFKFVPTEVSDHEEINMIRDLIHIQPEDDGAEFTP